MTGDMINLTINGQQVSVEQGTTVFEAAQTLGIKVPTLCYHKALSPYGACRLCLVEIGEGDGAFLRSSCLYPAQEGLFVQTDTERVVRTHKIMMELLLARCPDAKKVRELAEELGVKETRIPKKNEDCILCGLCIRMCRERMGDAAIGFAERGIDREVIPPFRKKSAVCMGCGACESICPTSAIKAKDNFDGSLISIPSEFDMGLMSRSVIHIPFPQAVPSKAIIDRENCVHFIKDKCGICEVVCEKGAIDYEQQEEELDINVGAIVLAPGYDKFEPKEEFQYYGYGRYENVITSMEFERVLSASGPYQGHLVRLSDKKEPEKIAFIQCVGSRDKERPYCSSVCCMYATKEAIIAKEHSKAPLDCHIYFMDMRAYGKDFERYYERAEEEHGIEYRRCRVSAIVENPDTKKLKIRFEAEDGKLKTEEYDIVILSIGFTPPKQAERLKESLGIKLNKYGFIETLPFLPINTTRDGIFVCGASSEPKDIPETVAEASGAASRVSAFLPEVRGTQIVEREYPPEMDVSDKEPRIGAFICHCGINIGGYVNVPEVVEYIKNLPYVVYAEHNLYTCSQDTQEKIKEMIKEHNLNRVLVASCTPRTHEPLFQDTIREAGLNPFLFEFVNIRDQCSWVHMKQKKEATEKAKDLVRMGIIKASLLKPITATTSEVNPRALVIGGGLSGLTSAISLSEQGFEVYLVEKEPELGGNLRHIFYTIDGNDPQKLLGELVKKVEEDDKIHIFKEANIEEVTGYLGNFKTTIKTVARYQLPVTREEPVTSDQSPAASNEQQPITGNQQHGTENSQPVTGNGQQETRNQIELEHGIIIVATGAKEYKPKEYLYGKDERIITQKELEKRLSVSSNRLSPNTEHQIPNTVVMIQCVGSRDEEHPYCSRICCSQAVKNSLKIKELHPKAEVFVLYRDMRAYGFKEEYYQKAREKGVIFIRYDLKGKPDVSLANSKLSVEVKDPILNQELLLNPDLLVLSCGIIPDANEELSKILKVPLNADKFFLEAHVKLRPLDFATDGVFLCGLAHSPKLLEESIVQAQGAAGRAATVLSKKYIEAKGKIAVVNPRLCSGCRLCIEMCPYDAREIDEETGVSKVIDVLCQGCGACCVGCPNSATRQKGFERKQEIVAIDAALGF